MNQLLPLYEAGQIGQTGKGSILEMMNAKEPRNPVTRNWLKGETGSIARLQRIRALGEPVVEAWLQVMDAARAGLKTKGVGDWMGAKRTLKATALSRVTKAFLREPDQWPNPLVVGNPEVGDGPGTIADALLNPKRYQPRRDRRRS